MIILEIINGEEKRNTTLWYNNNFIGTELILNCYAKLQKHVDLKVLKFTLKRNYRSLQQSCRSNGRHNHFIEVILNQELGEPFRRDAMKAPVEVAGIDPKDTMVQ